MHAHIVVLGCFVVVVVVGIGSLSRAVIWCLTILVVCCVMRAMWCRVSVEKESYVWSQAWSWW